MGLSGTRSVFDAASVQEPRVYDLPLVSGGLERKKVTTFFLQVLEKEHCRQIGAFGTARIFGDPVIPFSNNGPLGWRIFLFRHAMLRKPQQPQQNQVFRIGTPQLNDCGRYSPFLGRSCHNGILGDRQ